MNQELKIKLARVVSTLTPVAMKFESISEPESAYFLSSEHEHENEQRFRLSKDLN